MPGRIADHLRNTKGFSLHTLKFLVLDEAGRLLDLDFGTLDDMLKAISKQRTPDNAPLRVETSSHPTLLPYHPSFFRSFAVGSALFYLRSFSVIPLHGDLTRGGLKRNFTNGDTKILVATDVASRFIHLSAAHDLLDLQVGCGYPTRGSRHRLRHTVKISSIVSGEQRAPVIQYDVELLQLSEKKLEEWPTDKEDVLAMHPTVDEAERVAANGLREGGKQQRSRKRKRQAGESDDQGIEASWDAAPLTDPAHRRRGMARGAAYIAAVTTAQALDLTSGVDYMCRVTFVSTAPHVLRQKILMIHAEFV
ncbi:hypothetical protein EDD18DRAFT_1356470 [Armillaria luteobubalina]|uniref:Helicase C-terminal domain-containing protein n=1 Tax=Armillaria luteobubalina TaxID=153913 RepID=A0AA39PZU1_9AGAR|nr:hypothetical protein EDD18DRAFT_1356470 [Armillaria luteobubalina]